MDQVEALKKWKNRKTNELTPDAMVEIKLQLDKHYGPINELIEGASREFDANTGYSRNTDIFLTNCIGRSPNTKVHLGIGRAMQSVKKNAGSVWELDVDGSYWHRIAYSYVYWNPDNNYEREVVVVVEDGHPDFIDR